jgi:SAM-dependent methyltransferase
MTSGSPVDTNGRVPASGSDGFRGEVKRAWQGTLPERYEQTAATFMELASPSLTPGCRILDVGAGRTPVFSPEMRPEGCEYVGLDISRDELEGAKPGSYDSFEVGDITKRTPQLEGGFDFVVTMQLLEHVKSLDDAFDNMYAYLRPGGRMLAQLSGTFSFFALAGRVIPISLTRAILVWAQRRNPASVFPAYYHHCWASAIERITPQWSKVEVIPIWSGNAYLTRSRPLLALNTAYEYWGIAGNHDNLATHYIIDAQR